MDEATGKRLDVAEACLLCTLGGLLATVALIVWPHLIATPGQVAAGFLIIAGAALFVVGVSCVAQHERP
jgi:hypothetical protein